MKSFRNLNLLIALVMTLTITLVGSSVHAYTREELETLSKETLIRIILDVQDVLGMNEKEPMRCRSFSPLNGEIGSILIPKRHPGYNDDGTLSYPNGQLFMLRHNGFNDDKTVFYPNGKALVLKHEGYNDNNKILWPNGNTLRLRHTGYNDDGSIFRSNGNDWLRRHIGYSDDRQRFGLPVEKVKESNFTVNATLTDADSVDVVTKLSGEGWTVEISVFGESDEIIVKECLE